MQSIPTQRSRQTPQYAAGRSLVRCCKGSSYRRAEGGDRKGPYFWACPRGRLPVRKIMCVIKRLNYAYNEISVLILVFPGA